MADRHFPGGYGTVAEEAKGDVMKRLHYYISGSALAMLLVLMLTTPGCSSISDNSPTSPGETGSASMSSDSYAEAFIRADQGGWLRMGSNRVYFPPGALAEDTLVSIVRVDDTAVFDLAPDGILFQAPVSLTLEMPPPVGFGARRQFSIPAIYYFNEDNEQWENIGGIPDYSKRVVTTQIEHFSRYGTISPIFH